ncbi:MAG: hypothetical protein AB4352_12590 [Hormoscilla sp.]
MENLACLSPAIGLGPRGDAAAQPLRDRVSWGLTWGHLGLYSQG